MADNNYRRNGLKGNIINGMSEKGKSILQAEYVFSITAFNLFFLCTFVSCFLWNLNRRWQLRLEWVDRWPLWVECWRKWKPFYGQKLASPLTTFSICVFFCVCVCVRARLSVFFENLNSRWQLRQEWAERGRLVRKWKPSLHAELASFLSRSLCVLYQLLSCLPARVSVFFRIRIEKLQQERSERKPLYVEYQRKGKACYSRNWHPSLSRSPSFLIVCSLACAPARVSVLFVNRIVNYSGNGQKGDC
jgi:hypothetical protein